MSDEISQFPVVALSELIAELPSDTVITDPALMDNYRYDWARDPNAGVPLAVVRPRQTSEIQVVMRWASTHQVPVVPRGAGSGLSGGSSAVAGGLVVSLDRMGSIEIDASARVAIVEPGALNAAVKTAAREHGLWYPPDPSSFEMCSIGGNIATNAGGLCCVKYGVTTDYVVGLDLVLADGTAISLGGPRLKDVAGLSLLKLFVGSEGTLAIVTKALLRLVPLPRPAATLVAFFPTVAAAANAVVAITQQCRPSMLELMDNASINAVEDYTKMGLDRTAGALLLAQSDAGGAASDVDIALIEEVCRAHGSLDCLSTTDPAEGEAFAAARRAAFPAIERLGRLLLEDVGVSIPKLPALLAGITDISKRNDTTIAVVAHAGDGNTHPLIVFDPNSVEAEVRAQRAFEEIMTLALALGGTITGEHGVGRLKKSHLPDQLGPDVMALTLRIKNALDPLNILNPGVIL